MFSIWPILTAILFILNYFIIERLAASSASLYHVATAIGLSVFGTIGRRRGRSWLGYCVITLCFCLLFLSLSPGPYLLISVCITSQFISSIFLLLSITTLYERANDGNAFVAFAVLCQILLMVSELVQLSTSLFVPLRLDSAAFIAVLLLISIVCFRRQTANHQVLVGQLSSSSSLPHPGPSVGRQHSFWPLALLWSQRTVISSGKATSSYREIQMRDEDFPLHSENGNGEGDSDQSRQSEQGRSSEALSSAASTGERDGNQKRAVSFSSLVTVKIIDSDVRTLTPLKRVATDDAPLLARPFVHDDGRDSRRSDESLQQGLPNGLKGRIPSPSAKGSPVFVRYSNGAEHNRMLLSVKNSLRSQLQYLLKRSDLISSMFLFGSNCLVCVFVSWSFSLFLRNAAPSPALVRCVSIASSFLLFLVFLSLSKGMLAEPVGLVRAFKLGFLILIPSLLLASVLSLLNWDAMDTEAVSDMAIFLLAYACEAASRLGAVCSLAASLVMLNNSCYARHRSLVNGFSLCGVALLVSVCQALYDLRGSFLPTAVVSALAGRSDARSDMQEPVEHQQQVAVPALRATCFLVVAFAAYTVSAFSKNFPKTILRRKREPRTPRYCEYYREDMNVDMDHSQAERTWEDVTRAGSIGDSSFSISFEEEKQEANADVAVGFIGDDERANGLAPP